MSSPEASLSISVENGVLTFIYDDELLILAKLGKMHTKRATHVEPYEGLYATLWKADLSPSGGPKLIGFETRREALDAEVEWLKENVL